MLVNYIHIHIKVHLTPKMFFAKQNKRVFLEYFSAKIFWIGQILDFLCPSEVQLGMAHDRV